MNYIDISFESLNFNESRLSSSSPINESDRNESNISLEDMYETISLYDYINDETTNSKRITWEQWYLNKKIEKLKNEKKLEEKMRKVCFEQIYNINYFIL